MKNRIQGDLNQDRSSNVPTINLFKERQKRMLRKQHTISDFNYKHNLHFFHDYGNLKTNY